MKTNVEYAQTVSKNYQSRSHRFGFEVETSKGAGGFAKVRRAQELCEAVVRAALGEKLGKRRHEMDELAQEFFGVSWQEMATGTAEQDVML